MGKSEAELKQRPKSGERKGLVFQPRRAALLIIDMQEYFLDARSHAYIPGSPGVLRKIRDLAGAFRKRKLPVILTRHVNTAKNAGLMGRWWADLITQGGGLSQIDPGLRRLGCPVIRKTQYDAFHKTPLESLLRRKQVSQLVIAGVATHLCCETTARSAFVRGFAVFLPVDATATFDRDFFRASLLNLSHGFAVLTTVRELVKKLGEKPHARP
jgi:bifunctional isochorismate lyase/aryl carrier protein